MKVVFVYPDIGSKKLLLIPHITFPLLAALTPMSWDVSIIDANFQDSAYVEGADVVAYTTTLANYEQCRDSAKLWKERGATTVIGGPVATLCPEECLRHFDVVFRGEAELTWPLFCEEFEAGVNPRVYKQCRPTEADEIPLPRRDLLNPRGYWCCNTVMATRGCVNSCRFCTVRYIYPRRPYMTRPVADVVNEIATTFVGSAVQRKHFVFCDDNLTCDRVWAKELFTALKPLRKRWVGCMTLDSGDDDELLRLAYEGGCRCVEVGVESINPEVLKAQGKTTNIARLYAEQVERFHDHGIAIQAVVMFGFDEDSANVFRQTLDAMLAARVDLIVPLILTPYPNTAPWAELKAQGRITTNDWTRYDGRHAVYRPARMTVEELEAGREWFLREFYRFDRIARRVPGWGLSALAGVPFSLATRSGLKQGATHVS